MSSFRSVGVALAVVATAGPLSAQSTADGTQAAAQFGRAVALVGDQALVGEPAGGTGKVHVYRRVAGRWEAASQLPTTGLAANAGFGLSVAGEGTTLLVGMQNAADSVRGGVKVFTRTANGPWTAAGALGDTPVARSQFGASVAVRGDWAFVGAPGTAPGGAVHVYRRSATGWTGAGTLPAADLVAGDRFGITLSVDGDRVAVGAPGRDAQKGMVYVFRQAGGTWTQEGAVAGRRVPANSQLSLGLLLVGDRLYAGAPNANGFAGMVATFRRGSDNQWVEGATLAGFEIGTARFGSSIARMGNELWIGASSDSRTGNIFRVTMDSAGALGGMIRFGGDVATAGSSFGTVMAGSGTTVVVGMPNDASGEGTVAFFQRNAAGQWASAGTVYPSTGPGLASITGAEKMCDADGKAEGYPCGNTSMLSFLPTSAIGGGRGARLSGNWGWTDSTTGRDYALIGRTDGTSFVDVTDPARPRYLGNLPLTAGANPSSWTEIKTYRNYALVTKDGSGPHGVQIFDLTRLRNVRTPQTFTADVIYDKVANVHDILANNESGFAYAVGSNGGGESCGGGYHMIDMRDPLNPTFAGCHADTQTGRAGTGYSHDALCVIYRGPDVAYRGKEICVGSNETALSIADFSDKKNIRILSRATYPNIGYIHQGWWTEDHRYFYVDDELDETGGAGLAAQATRTLVFDFADLEDPVLVKEFLGTTKASDHNQYVRGNRLYQSNYKAGLRILDISDPRNPREVGYFDVSPDDDNSPGFSGSWNNYPFFKNGAILVSSIELGIFMVRDRTQAVP